MHGKLWRVPAVGRGLGGPGALSGHQRKLGGRVCGVAVGEDGGGVPAAERGGVGVRGAWGGRRRDCFWWGDEICLSRANLETCVHLTMCGRGEDARMVPRWESTPMQESRWLTQR